MTAPLLVLLLFGGLILVGRWLRLGPVQWIWLLFGAAIALIVIWVVLIVFVIGPDMLRTGPPG